jgi:hypothetical protein
MPPLSSVSKNKPRKVVSCFANSSIPKMEATCSYETSFDFQCTTRRYIPEYATIHNHRCEDLRPYISGAFDFMLYFSNRTSIYLSRLRAGTPTSRGSSPGIVKTFSLPHGVYRPALGPTQLPTQWVPGTLSPELKRPEREAGQSPPTSADVKKTWSYTSTLPYVFMLQRLIS